MANNINGKDFLFSDDCGFINGEDEDGYRYSDGSGYYHGNDGSEGYIYSDGTGYYHGADGSDGYIYYDGSAYYHGADGTDAYKYSDGSGYYHGADGSDGYKYSDGSGYYQSSDGSYYHFDASDDEEDEDDEDDEDEDEYDDHDSGEDDNAITESLDLKSGLVLLTLGIGAFAVVKHIVKAKEDARREEEERLERERIVEEQRRIRQAKKEKERKQRNKRIKAFFFAKKKLAMEFDSFYLVGKRVNFAIEAFKEAGFNNYKAVAIKDIYVGANNYVGQVEQVVIDGQSWFVKGTMVPYDAEIIITFHAKKSMNFHTP